ncbi:MAG: LpxI family protein [Aquificae bacterium]|nr:LpxI family protein [Aquificota bacterium]
MPIGLIAGKGELPKVFREEALKRGEEVITAGIKGITDMEADEIIPLGKVGRLIKVFKKRNVDRIVMLGKFEHRLIYTSLLQLDLKAISILRKSKDRRPASLIKAFMEALEEEGFVFIDPKPYLESILAVEGVMGRRKPSEEAKEDGIFGFLIAKELAEMDIGQTVVVKNKAVVAVEAMEGTQETILRGGKLGGKGVRVVKVARKTQDFRIDVPTVGLQTLEALRQAKADALFLEAGKVYIVQKEKFLRNADRLGISVVGIC